MDLDFAAIRTSLRAQCDAISRLFLSLPEHQFVRPTRLPPWDVLHLAAHLYRDLERVPLALETPRPAATPDTDVLTYWRYDRIENAARTQARADLIVASYDTGAGLARAFDAIERRANSMLDDAQPDLVIQTWEPIMRIDDFAATRVVEVVIHGLDLAHALDRPPEVHDEALAITSDVLDGLLAAPRPANVNWDTTTWIEKASGRIALTPTERTTLGRLGEAFPLLA